MVLRLTYFCLYVDMCSMCSSADRLWKVRHRTDRLWKLRHRTDKLWKLTHRTDRLWKLRHRTDMLWKLRHRTDLLLKLRHRTDMLLKLRHRTDMLLKLRHRTKDAINVFCVDPEPSCPTSYAVWATWAEFGVLAGNVKFNTQKKYAYNYMCNFICVLFCTFRATRHMLIVAENFY